MRFLTLAALLFFCSSSPSFNSDRDYSARLKLVREALKNGGKGYRWSASGPDTFDCSGFVNFIHKKLLGTHFNLERILKRRAHALDFKNHLSRLQAEIKCSQAEVGDIIFFERRPPKYRNNHVGIITHPKESYFLTAQSSKRGVRLATFKKGSYWQGAKPRCFKNIWLNPSLTALTNND